MLRVSIKLSERSVRDMSEAQIRIEIERIVNLVAGFGWRKVEEATSAGEVRITLAKTVPVSEGD